jgi:Uncharacterized conserved protein (DUF2285)
MGRKFTIWSAFHVVKIVVSSRSRRLNRTTAKSPNMSNSAFQDQPPINDTLTNYDRAHLKLYMRLLDAEANGADWREVAQVLFGVDPGDDPQRAEAIHAAHLARAKWMTAHGYRQLLAQ